MYFITEPKEWQLLSVLIDVIFYKFRHELVVAQLIFMIKDSIKSPASQEYEKVVVLLISQGVNPVGAPKSPLVASKKGGVTQTGPSFFVHCC